MAVQIRQLIPNRDESRPTHLHHGAAAEFISERLIGVSQWAREARSAVLAHAAHDNPILIEGGPGTGKELARVHDSFDAQAAQPGSCGSTRKLRFLIEFPDTLSSRSFQASYFIV